MGMSWCVLLALVVLCLGAPPPHGSRSASESKSLHENRQNDVHRPIPHVTELKAAFFDRYIKPEHWKENRNRYWLVLFYASWCLRCQDYIEPFAQLANKVHEHQEHDHLVDYKQKLPRGQLSMGKHDTTFGDVIALKYGVEGYPTVLLFDRDDDKKITKFEGTPSFEDLLEFVRRNTDVRI